MTPAAPPPPAPPVRPGDRRAAPRRQPAVGTVCQLDLGPSGKPTTALVWNISATGLSLLVHEPRDAGALLAGELETVADRHGLPVAMHVVHVKRLETGDYFLGAHFIRPLTAEEMSRFVV